MDCHWNTRIHLHMEDNREVLRAIRFYRRAFGAVYLDDDDDDSVHLKVFGVDVLLNKPGFSPMNEIWLRSPADVDIGALIDRAAVAGGRDMAYGTIALCNCCNTILGEVTDPFDNKWCFSKQTPIPRLKQPAHFIARFIPLMAMVHYIQLRPLEYAIVAAMILYNRYTWKFWHDKGKLWDKKVAPKIDSQVAKMAVPYKKKKFLSWFSDKISSLSDLLPKKS